jgi:hypothetical protein
MSDAARAFVESGKGSEALASHLHGAQHTRHPRGRRTRHVLELDAHTTAAVHVEGACQAGVACTAQQRVCKRVAAVAAACHRSIAG